MDKETKEKKFLLRRLVAVLFFVAGFLFFVATDQVRAVDGIMNGKTITGETDNYLFWLQTYDSATSPYFFDKLFMDKAGNVGIGKTNPSVALDVIGAGNFTSTVNGTGLCIAGDCKTTWAAIGAAGSGWTQNGSNVYKTDTAGNVGVGTTNPSYPLTVYSTVAGSVAEFRNNSSNVSYISITDLSTGSGTANGLTLGYNG